MGHVWMGTGVLLDNWVISTQTSLFTSSSRSVEEPDRFAALEDDIREVQLQVAKMLQDIANEDNFKM